MKITVTLCFEYKINECFCVNEKSFDFINLPLALINPSAAMSGFNFSRCVFLKLSCLTHLKIVFVTCCFSSAVILEFFFFRIVFNT